MHLPIRRKRHAAQQPTQPNHAPPRTVPSCRVRHCGVCRIVLQLFRLQILRHDELESAALQQQLRRTAIPASRGTIYDREGRVLAMSATTYTVYVSPAEISMNGEDAERIASVFPRSSA